MGLRPPLADFPHDSLCKPMTGGRRPIMGVLQPGNKLSSAPRKQGGWPPIPRDSMLTPTEVRSKKNLQWHAVSSTLFVGVWGSRVHPKN